MKRSLIQSTALALILAGPAFADSHSGGTSYVEMQAEGDIQTSELMGMRVYATENEVGEDAAIAEGGEQEWDDIGEINDVVLSRDGMVKAVVLGVGGFLGIGEKDVAIEMSSLKFVAEQDDPDDFFLVVNSSKAMLEEAPAFRDAEMQEQAEILEEQKEEAEEAAESTTAAVEEQTEEAQDAAEDTTAAADEQKAEGADDTQIVAAERTMLTPPTVERDGYMEGGVEDLTAETLQGMTVYGPKDESVGEIGKLILDESGQITDAVIDVGGFLGIGEREVSVSFDELRILRQDGGDDVRLYIDSSEEQLEQLPVYEG